MRISFSPSYRGWVVVNCCEKKNFLMNILYLTFDYFSTLRLNNSKRHQNSKAIFIYVLHLPFIHLFISVPLYVYLIFFIYLSLSISFYLSYMNIAMYTLREGKKLTQAFVNGSISNIWVRQSFVIKYVPLHT